MLNFSSQCNILNTNTVKMASSKLDQYMYSDLSMTPQLLNSHLLGSFSFVIKKLWKIKYMLWLGFQFVSCRHTDKLCGAMKSIVNTEHTMQTWIHMKTLPSPLAILVMAAQRVAEGI